MKIASLLKLSTIDFPDTLAAVIFTNGCNFNCGYCHNRSLIDGRAASINNNEVFSFLKQRKHMLDGLVITGGEPTIQHDLIDFLQHVKKLGYKIKLDTNGSKPDVLKEALPLLGYVAIDYKAPAPLFDAVCGVAARENVLESIRLLGASNVTWELRTTLAPEVVTSLDEIKAEIEAIPMVNKYVCHRLNEYRKP